MVAIGYASGKKVGGKFYVPDLCFIIRIMIIEHVWIRKST